MTYPGEFQWGHFFAEMDSSSGWGMFFRASLFQLGHFFAEMDRGVPEKEKPKKKGFNWATSLQKWIDKRWHDIV